jgi:hypothetical protein
LRPRDGGVCPLFATLSKIGQFFFGEVFDADVSVCGLADAYKFIELGLDGCAVPVLSVLNQEDHQTVTIVVPVFMMSCHVSEKPKSGPEAAHTMIMMQHRMKVTGPGCAIAVAAWAKPFDNGEAWITDVPPCGQRRTRLLGQPGSSS